METAADCVKVAVNIRPLLTTELLAGCSDFITVVPGEPQVQIGVHAFTYDHVYGSSASPSSALFEECVEPIVDAFLHGYNGTVLAYGQTGSGKTFTMGTNYNGETRCGGIIPRAMDSIFEKLTFVKNVETLIRVSFIEIFKEEVYDLLEHHSVKTEGTSRTAIQIRETASGGITLAGVIEPEVRSKEEMSFYLSRGSLARATGSTNMNSQSSRSHAIFTICLEQKKTHEVGDDIIFAKLHLVDLAGSERAKRTGADGSRLKEGIHINRGLLALGNVISALGDDKKRKEGGHVPYRDSKLTRLLQDSLGGNSKTVMIACISPADGNAEETANTLKYANRARNIQNKAVINRDPQAAELLKMRNLLEQCQTELHYYRGGGATTTEEIHDLRQRLSLLEARHLELQCELKMRQTACEQLAQQALDAKVEKDKLILKLESVRNGQSLEEIDDAENAQERDLVQNYIVKIQDLEAELLRAQCFSSGSEKGFMDCLNPNIGEVEDAKEQEHSSLQDRLDMELKELDKQLEQKEAEMKQFAVVDMSSLKQHYEKKLLEMENEKRALQKEIENLRLSLASLSSFSDDSAQKLREDYLQKLNMLDAQVSDLKKKQEAQAQLLRQKQRSDDAAKKLQEEIQKIKAQKVQLHHKIKQEAEQFRVWKATREKEVLQLKKEGRRNEYEMHKLMALNQRQKMVLQRKSDEAALATKRLKELLDARKSFSQEYFGQGSANVPRIQSLIRGLDHELEVITRVHEVRLEHARQEEGRAALADELARLKEESKLYGKKMLSEYPQAISPSARSSRISALENMISASSSTLVSMALQLSEAEECGRVFSDKGRWNQVRSLVEAKNLLNHLFNSVSSSRCQLQDKESICRENNAIISELKEKIVSLNSLARKLESQRDELQEQIIKCPLPSQILKKTTRNTANVLDDMDTEESDGPSDASDTDWDSDCNCSCSQFSSCKTRRCQCRAAGKTCSDSCECKLGKCMNRKGALSKNKDKESSTSPPEIIECAEEGNSKADDDISEESKKSDEIVSHATALLQNALVQGPIPDQPKPRKALSDIGNTKNAEEAKPARRKKWRKSAIQLLVTKEDPPALSAAVVPQENNNNERTGVVVDDSSLKLPRAFNNNIISALSDRNTGTSSEGATKAKPPRPRSPVRSRKPSNQKENDLA